MHTWPWWFFLALKVGVLVLSFGAIERVLTGIYTQNLNWFP